MKKLVAIALAVILLFAFTACSKNEAAAESAPALAVEATVAPAAESAVVSVAAPAAKPTPAPAPERPSAPYAQMLQSGTYCYSLAVKAGSATQTVTSAAKDGMYYFSTGVQNDSIGMLVRDGKGYAVRQLSGEILEFDPATQGKYLPDYATLAFKDVSEADGKTTETYTCKTKDGGEGTVVFVFESGKLTEISTPELTVEGTWPVTDFGAEPSDALFAVPAASEGPVSPYAWLGYAELPQCSYFDIMSTGCYYREYDLYALGHVVHQVQASDIANHYEYDGANNTTLILNGMSYVLNAKNKTYAQRDATSVWSTTLETQAKYREQGINATGKKFVTTGSGPVPLLSESGDAADYVYYEFFADFSTDKVFTERDRIYMKDGDVYAIHTLITNGDHETEMMEVITSVSATPDPGLFALPVDFDEYAPIG